MWKLRLQQSLITVILSRSKVSNIEDEFCIRGKFTQLYFFISLMVSCVWIVTGLICGIDFSMRIMNGSSLKWKWKCVSCN